MDPHRKNISSSGSGFTPKAKMIKNAGKIPSNITNRHILSDVQNMKMMHSSSQQGIGGAIHQKAYGATSCAMRNVHLHNSSPELPLPANNYASSNKNKYSGVYESNNNNKNNDVLVLGKASRDSPSTSSKLSAKEMLETILSKVNKLEEKNKTILDEVRANNSLLKNVFKRQSNSGFKKPECLPFACVEELVAFNSANEDKFVEVVNFLAYLGGLNVTDTAARYLKQSLDMKKELISKITWTGSKKANMVSLAATKFMAACEEAMALNTSWIVKPTKTEFTLAINKALKSLKERLRRKLQEPEVRARRVQQADEWRITQDENNDEDKAHQEMEEVEEEVEEEVFDDDDECESKDLFKLYK